MNKDRPIRPTLPMYLKEIDFISNKLQIYELYKDKDWQKMTCDVSHI